MIASNIESVGQRLKRLRELHGWSQPELAGKIDAPTQNINRWENNKSLPQPHYRKKLSEVFGLSIEELFTLQKDRATSQKPPDNRPVIITDIIGREEDIAHIISLIQKGEKFITLVGTTGVGKTRLALEITKIIDQHVYADIASSYRFVDLTKYTNPNLANVPGFVARELDIECDGSPESILAALPSEPLLLVIDNLEHILQEKKGFFLELVQTSIIKKKPNVFLFTSRIPFNIQGESLSFVESLTCPKDVSLFHEERDLKNYAATNLFYERASKRDTSIKFTETDAKYIARLCQALDGLPLAIEIVASHISKNDSPQAIYDDMKAKGIVVLDLKNKYSVKGHHDTLWNTIKWSCDLLSEPQRKLFYRLSLFHGGCSVDAAYKVCNREGDIAGDETAIEELLDKLEENSLLKRNGRNKNARYSMLHVIALFAQEKLQEKPEEYEALRARFAEYYINRGNEWNIELSAIERFDEKLLYAHRKINKEAENILTAGLHCALLAEGEGLLRIVIFEFEEKEKKDITCECGFSYSTHPVKTFSI